jgi:DNA replicative helicase MCM subunit Mcm2 (Cdc46/Mcm family)
MRAHQQHPNDEGPIGDIGNGNDIIELIPAEELQGEQIVTVWFCSFKSKQMTIKFNGRYQNKLLDSIPVDLEDMRDMVEGFRNILENNGIAEEHITMLENILISNNPRITAFYAQAATEQTTEGQRRKKERIDKLRNTPPREVSVAQALMIREAGTNVRVTGKLIGRLVVENMIEIAAFRCANCDEWNILEDYRDTRPRLQAEMPSDFESKNLHKKMCKICFSDKVPHMSDHKYIPARSVELHGEEISNDIPYINIYLFNNCTINVLYNELVKVTGSIQQIRVKDKLLPHVFVGLESDGSIINDISPIEPFEKEESVEITPKDEEEFQEFYIKKGDNFRQVFDALASLVAPHHQGHDSVKKGLLMSAVMTGIDSPRRKRRIDIMFIGPTGTDKSGLASEAKRLVPGSDTASAADSTSNSLICVYDKDGEHFNFGKIPLANGKVLHLDEMGLWKHSLIWFLLRRYRDRIRRI